MLHTSGTDVIKQLSTVLTVLAPIYAIAFGLMAVRALLDKGMRKIFPNYKPYGRRTRGRSSVSRTSKRPQRTSTTKAKTTTSTSKRIPGAIAPAKRSQRTTIFLDAAKNPEVKKVNEDYYVTYSSGGNRTTMYLKSTRNPVVRKVGNTVQVSYD